MLPAVLQSNDLLPWSHELGLLPVPLFGGQETDSYILLNGTRGNFCLDLRGTSLTDRTRNYSWSSDVGHYVSVGEDYVEVQRWDRGKAIERYTRESVLGRLQQFHEYLEKSVPRDELSVVSHTLKIFRSVRAVLDKEYASAQALRAFLYLLATATANISRKDLDIRDWGLSSEAQSVANVISDTVWQRLQRDLQNGRRMENLRPHLDLLLRHAAGRMFQEAHYEAIFLSQLRLPIDEILPDPVELRHARKATGAYYTPTELVRAIVEESLHSIDLARPLLRVFDPACGSGEFLREVIRQLGLRQFSGHLEIFGWDISEAACDMANFVLAWETQQLQNVSVDIRCMNSLLEEAVWPEDVNLIVMNPPFVSWEAMSSEEQQRVRQLLRDVRGSRPDVSHAFLLKAVSSLAPEGVLGSVVPASLFYSVSARRLRGVIAETLSPQLVARIGSTALFSAATVDVGIYIGRKVDRGIFPGTVLWTDHRLNSTSTALRELRKVRYLNAEDEYPIIGDGYSIYRDLPTKGDQQNHIWFPQPYESLRLFRSVDHLPRVISLFDVKQGARTGANRVFILSHESWAQLPTEEQAYFRPAVVNASIEDGFLRQVSHVFFPYGEHTIDSPEQLVQAVPRYYANYLYPAKSELVGRSGIDRGKWWCLTRHRNWQVRREPKLVSTKYGDAGSFAWDSSGNFVVVQGFAWLPKVEQEEFSPLPNRFALAYLAILNSQFFSQLLSAVARRIGGGQWDLSRKFVKDVPIPNLMGRQMEQMLLSELVLVGELLYTSKPVDEETHEEIVAAAYGLDTPF